MTAPFDVAVVGAGVMGCSTALFLARGGMRVALLDRGEICREASGVNAGTLTMQMTRAALIPYALRAHEMWLTMPRLVRRRRRAGHRLPGPVGRLHRWRGGDAGGTRAHPPRRRRADRTDRRRAPAQRDRTRAWPMA